MAQLAQTQLTYNLIAGLNWCFAPRWSAVAGWRYLNIDLQKGTGARTRHADIAMTGPFLAVNRYF